MKTKHLKKNILSLGILSAFSVTPLFVGGLFANAQMTSPGTNQSPTQTTPGATNQPGMNTTPGATNQPGMNTTPGAINQPGMNTVPGTTNQPTITRPNTFGTYSPENAPLLSMGSRGATVRDVQTFLNAQGLYNGPIDGIYGPQTQSAVTQFQRANNLRVDGMIGSETWEAMIGPNQPQDQVF